MKSTNLFIRFSSILCWLLSAAAVEANVIGNSGFEQGTPEDFGTLEAWSQVGNAFGYRSYPPSYTATEGGRLAVFNGGSNVFNAAISQSFPTIPGRSYRLSLDHGITGVSGKKQRLLVVVDGNTRRLNQTADITASGSTALWSQRNWSFTADSDLTTLTLADGSAALSATITNAADMLIDNVQVIAPELSSITLESIPANGVSLVADTVDLDGLTGGNTPFTLNYPSGEVVSLTAPRFYQGQRLSGWQENGQPTNSNNVLKLTVTADTRVAAVYEQNQEPITEDDAYATKIDTLLVVPAPGVLANDADADGDSLESLLTQNTENGSVTLMSDGSFTYMPAPGFTGTDSFQYLANDGGAQSVEGTVTIIVSNTSTQIIANGSFETGAASSGGITEINHWSAVGRAFGYIGDGNYTVRDGSRLAVFNGGGNDFSGSLAQPFASTPRNAYRVDFAAGILASATRKQRMNIRLQGETLLADRTIELSTKSGPAKWTELSQTFIADASTTTLTFSDASGSLPSTQTSSSDLLLDDVRVVPLGPTVKLQVESRSDEIVAIDVTPTDFNGTSAGTGSFERTYLQDTTVTLSATRISGDDIFRHWLRNDVIYGSDLTVSFVMDSDQSWVAVYMRPLPPEASADSYTIIEDETLVVGAPGLLSNDLNPEPGAASAMLESQARNGSVIVAEDGSFTYQPQANFYGTDSFTYHASNDVGSSDAVEVTVVVESSNDSPQAVSTEWIIQEDQTLQIRLDASDVDGDPLAYTVAPPLHGMLSGTAPDFIYTPDPDFHGMDSFVWHVSDGKLESAPATVSIQVDPVNDPPEALAASYSIDSSESLQILLTGDDREGSPLIFTVVEQPLFGRLVGDPPYLTYQATVGWHGEDRFSFTVSDGLATSAAASIVIEVMPPAIPIFTDWLNDFELELEAAGDPDGDNIANLLEYVLGSDPTLAESERAMPTVAMIENQSAESPAAENRVLFQFRRTDRSQQDPTVTIDAEWSTSPMGGWQPADHAHGAIITVLDDAAGPGIDLIQVTMPRPSEGRFFARLRVSHVSESSAAPPSNHQRKI
jgi:hypothetical protein